VERNAVCFPRPTGRFHDVDRDCTYRQYTIFLVSYNSIPPIISLDIPIFLHFIGGLDVFVGSIVRVVSSVIFENVLVDRR
jgi:hypothetical protein